MGWIAKLRYLDFLLHAAVEQRKLFERSKVTNFGRGGDVHRALHDSYIEDFNTRKFWWMQPRENLTIKKSG